MDNPIAVSKIVWNECFGLKESEKALVIADMDKLEIAHPLWTAGQRLCRECMMMVMEKRSIDGEEPPEAVAKAMLGADAIVIPTTFSLTHTRAAQLAIKKGARIATMPNITRGMFMNNLALDYGKLKGDGEKIIKKLKSASGNVRITTAAGTDISLNIRGRKMQNCCGLVRKRGELTNLPDGEVAIAPVEGKTEGKIVVDLTCAPDKETKFGRIGRVHKSFEIVVKNGQAVDIGNPVLERWLNSVKNGTNVAELGIGTNWKAKAIGNVLLDEKIRGTAHIAFGTSKALGGKVQSDVHLDCIFNKPTIKAGKKTVMRNGKLI